MESAIDLATLKLAVGKHDDRSNGLCLLEAVAYFAGGPHTDHPECTCPVLGAMGRGLNDCMPDDERQQLRDLIPPLVGTAGSAAIRIRRANMVADWIVRVYTPAWLELAGLTDKAAALRSLPELTGTDSFLAAQPTIDEVKKSAAAARADADAIDYARAAARAAAWAAAWDAAVDAAWAAMMYSVRDAAWAAARAAARAATMDAAKNGLLKTSRELRASALDLFRRMIAAG